MEHAQHRAAHRQQLQGPQAFAIEHPPGEHHRQGQQEVAEGNFEHPPLQWRPEEQPPLHADQQRRHWQGRQQQWLAPQPPEHRDEDRPLPGQHQQQQYRRNRPEHALGEHLHAVQRRQLAHIAGHQGEQYGRYQGQRDTTTGQPHDRLGAQVREWSEIISGLAKQPANIRLPCRERKLNKGLG
ncbi:hypothetical protein D3C81_1594680 [compost metagenome]